MTAYANQEKIWINERGNVEMDPEVFMERERYILKLEARQDLWESDKEFKEMYRADLEALSEKLMEERKARDAYERAQKQRNWLWLLGGVLIGSQID
jgi:ABC-type Zn uptake system ZnuABC Zn-binding protein ZnuA